MRRIANALKIFLPLIYPMEAKIRHMGKEDEEKLPNS
jgi:hypothetical protein